ncbi:MAG: spermidine synthase [Chloroflexota bacterium]
MTPSQHRYLYFSVFAAGMTTLAVEFGASHLLGPYFGTSNLVWASIIGLILVYLTLGYFIGGVLADRSPFPHTMYSLLAWSSFLAGLVPLAARPVLLAAAEAFDSLEIGVLLGSFAGVLILFSLPITLQGMISPFAIRLSMRGSAHAGRVSGEIYAISTLGSFIGTFLPVLVLTPTVGTTFTFLAFSLFLNLVALGGLWLSNGGRATLRWAWMPVLLVILALGLGRGPIKTTAGQLYETESGYNYIEVLQQGEARVLRLNEGQGIHSVWHPTELFYGGPWEQFLAAPFFNPAPYDAGSVQRIGIIGLAAGTLARQATEAYGPIPIDGWEIDPKIISVGRRYFGMNQPNLNAIAEDGRVGLARSDRRYDIIAIDAYRPPYIPWHLTTQEFFQEVKDHLSEQGVMVINVGRSPTDRRLIDGLVGTIATVFPSIYVMDLPDTFNSIVYATRQPTSISDFYANYSLVSGQAQAHPLLKQVLAQTVVNLKPTPQSDVVFTDDHAPIEWLTNSLVLGYLLEGAEELK